MFLASALDGGVWATSRPGRSAPRKTPQYPCNKHLGGSQIRCGRCAEEKTIIVPRQA